MARLARMCMYVYIYIYMYIYMAGKRSSRLSGRAFRSQLASALAARSAIPLEEAGKTG